MTSARRRAWVEADQERSRESSAGLHTHGLIASIHRSRQQRIWPADRRTMTAAIKGPKSPAPTFSLAPLDSWQHLREKQRSYGGRNRRAGHEGPAGLLAVSNDHSMGRSPGTHE